MKQKYGRDTKFWIQIPSVELSVPPLHTEKYGRDMKIVGRGLSSARCRIAL